MTNFENIPEELFDWLNQFSFEKLSLEQQKVVEIWFSQDEYNTLHFAAKTAIEQEQKLQRNFQIKALLLRKFDSVYSKKDKSQNKYSWLKMAAIFVMLIGIEFLWGHLYFGKQADLHTCKVDTQYVYTQLPENTIYLYDTVYLIPKTKVKKEKRTKNEASHLHQTGRFVSIPEIRIKEFSELNSEANQIKGNSLKDDTLASIYSMVKL